MACIRIGFGWLALSCLLGACSGMDSPAGRLPYYNTEDFTPSWSHSALDTLHTIAAFNFTDQDGKVITRQSLDNKITVVNFFFARCPGICKKLTNNITAVQNAFKNDDDIILLSHSVTPNSDSVPVLKEYANEHGIISGKWHLLTGDRGAIYSLARHSYFADEDMGWKQDSTTFLHTENVLLIDPQHHIRGVYKGTALSQIDELIADIKLLKQEE